MIVKNGFWRYFEDAEGLSPVEDWSAGSSDHPAAKLEKYRKYKELLTII